MDGTADFQGKGRITINMLDLYLSERVGTRRGGADINAVVNELASAENGVVVFASSTPWKYSSCLCLPEMNPAIKDFLGF